MSVILQFDSHYFASLYGSLIALTDVGKGQELNERDIFSSLSHYELLAKIFEGLRESVNYSLTSDDERTILNSLGLYMPWINTIAGSILPRSQNCSEISCIQTKLFDQINFFQNKPKEVDWSWSNTILNYRLRKGFLSWEGVIELLKPLPAIIKNFHEQFYKAYWFRHEKVYYQSLFKDILLPSYVEKLQQGASLFYKWMGNPLHSKTLRICVNRYLASLNPFIDFNVGFGLPGSSTIHISPFYLSKPDLIFHEMAHVFLGDPKPFIYCKEISDLAKHIAPKIEIEESPIPFWTIEELIQHEIEEILADFLASQVIREKFEEISFSSTYSEIEPFLKPIYDRLLEFADSLDQIGFIGVVKKAFKEYKYLNCI